MMDKIPEDIMIKAEAAYDALGRGSDADAQVIARTILAERKRCAAAVLAEKLAGQTVDPTDISYDLAIEHAHDAIWRAA